MAPPQRAKRRKSVPSAREKAAWEQAAFGATAHKNKKKKEAPNTRSSSHCHGKRRRGGDGGEREESLSDFE